MQKIAGLKKSGKLPNLIVIGAMKCATTSLHYYLGLHPQISMSRNKELNFFIFEYNWHKGIEWYKSNFMGRERIYGESSPDYTNYPFFRGVPERICSVVPEVKLIYILRDPIERIISHYVHDYADGNENRTILDALVHLEDTNPYICRSKYYMQLEQYLKYFPRSNILIITLKDLYSNRRETLQKAFRFLNVDDTFYSSKFTNIHHQSSETRRKNRVGLLLKRISETNIAKMAFSINVRRNIGKILYLPFSSEFERSILDESLRGN